MIPTARWSQTGSRPSKMWPADTSFRRCELVNGEQDCVLSIPFSFCCCSRSSPLVSCHGSCTCPLFRSWPCVIGVTKLPAVSLSKGRCFAFASRNFAGAWTFLWGEKRPGSAEPCGAGQLDSTDYYYYWKLELWSCLAALMLLFKATWRVHNVVYREMEMLHNTHR